MAIAERQFIKGPSIPNPAIDPIGEAKGFYTAFYERERDDSPPESRVSLARRLGIVFHTRETNPRGLDLGSGRQIFEHEHPQHIAFATVDVASLPFVGLLAKPSSNTHHIQASGSALPFADNTFDVAVSNMALDFMPQASRTELYRVLRPHSPVVLNLHHPSMIPADLDYQIARLARKIEKKLRFKKMGGIIDDYIEMAVFKHKKYLRDEHVLFETPKQIRDTFSDAGFSIQRVSLEQSKGGYKWWEVDMSKRATLGPTVLYQAHPPTIEQRNTAWLALQKRRTMFERESELADLNKAIKAYDMEGTKNQARNELYWQRRVLRQEYAQFLKRHQ